MYVYRYLRSSQEIISNVNPQYECFLWNVAVSHDKQIYDSFLRLYEVGLHVKAMSPEIKLKT